MFSHEDSEDEQPITIKLWEEGRTAYNMGKPVDANPYTGLAAEYWLQGWEDTENE